MKHYVLTLLCEASTWRGIVRLLSAAGAAYGLTISPELGTAILTAGVAVSGLIGILFTDQLGGGK